MYDLVVFSHVRWDSAYQRPQQLMSRMALDRPVFFVEEPELTTGTTGMTEFKPCAGVTVLRARTLIGEAGFGREQRAMVRPMLRESLADHDVRDAVAWFYTPMALPLLDAVPARAVVYDCMDELPAFDPALTPLLQLEAELLQRADLVLTGGPSLYEAKRTRHANVHCFPSAVDADHFAPVPGREADCDIPCPRLGFFGAIDERLDLGLLAAIAKAEPGWQLVMVGPVVGIDPASLPHAANIHWLGQQPYAALPALLQSWQVCLMPFALNAATQFSSPTQTLEYMAAEKPVVSTAVPDVVRLHGKQVGVAGDTQGFIDLCRAALGEDTTQRCLRIATMRAAVSRTSWDRSVEAMRGLVAASARADVATPSSGHPVRWMNH